MMNLYKITLMSGAGYYVVAKDLSDIAEYHKQRQLRNVEVIETNVTVIYGSDNPGKHKK